MADCFLELPESIRVAEHNKDLETLSLGGTAVEDYTAAADNFAVFDVHYIAVGGCTVADYYYSNYATIQMDEDTDCVHVEEGNAPPVDVADHESAGNVPESPHEPFAHNETYP